MIGHTKIVMNDLNALRMPHYEKKSHHHDPPSGRKAAEQSDPTDW